MEEKKIHKVLLLSASTGQGHNTCAQAMAEYIRACGGEADVVDAFKYVSEGYANFMSKGHSMVYRWTPGLFQIGWNYCEKHTKMFNPGKSVHKKLAKGAGRLHDALVEGGYDMAISTHGLTAVMLTEMLRQYPMPELRTAFIATDYTCYPCMHSSDLEYYLIPEEELREAFGAFNIPQERMLIGGIPVRRSFHDVPDKRAAREQLGLHPEKRQLLAMGGSMGCGPMERIITRIAKDMGDDTEITVICGNNRKLYDRLTRRFKDNPAVHMTGYCNCVPLYMAAADVYLTKPGGISVSEATTIGLPMVLVNMVAGCEQYNLERFLRVGGAETAEGVDNLARMCLELLSDHELHKKMEDALVSTAPLDGAAVLWEALCAERADATGSRPLEEAVPV